MVDTDGPSMTGGSPPVSAVAVAEVPEDGMEMGGARRTALGGPVRGGSSSALAKSSGRVGRLRPPSMFSGGTKSRKATARCTAAPVLVQATGWQDSGRSSSSLVKSSARR